MKYKIKDFRVDFRVSQAEWFRLLSKRVKGQEIISYQILRKSVDARKNVLFVYQVMVEVKAKFSDKDCKSLGLDPYQAESYHLPSSYQVGREWLKTHPDSRPLVVGTGPAGLFAGLILAEAGLCPLILDRGQCVEKRQESVNHYNQTGQLNEESNIQFGEGGAGTFSDGKLNTGVKDRAGRRAKVLQTFVDCGAKPDILYDAKPHIGTDYLIKVVANMRRQIENLGGQIRFDTRLDQLLVENGRVKGLVTGQGEKILSDTIVLAIGHSARDTFTMLNQAGIHMEAKPFAVGLRIEHKQALIDRNQYGNFAGHDKLGAADYKLTYQAANGRRVYSFCMCPGGRVVNSASEKGRLVCNGMSYQARDLENANSAILVGVDQRDYGTGVLAGMEYQRRLEEKAFALGGKTYAMPIESFGDYRRGQREIFRQNGQVRSSLECPVKYADLSGLFSPEINEAIIEGIQAFGQKMEGFDQDQALLTGVESRSSSPVRIVRGDDFQSLNCQGLYPCGEGAGYAGGIMSAALDGIKTGEKVIAHLLDP